VQREEVAGLLSGEVFERKGYTNLVEEDFFNWLSPKDERVREWIALLSEGLFEVYDLAQISEDLLKELYQELVGPEMRHDTGEYYTPDWVAEQVLREAGFPPESKNPEEAALLDPACGSGTFLFIALRLLQEAGWSPQSIETFVTEHLRGMDINPLAVIIARINIVLALRSILQNRKPTKPITLPVYLANALIVKSPDDNKPVLFDIPVENIEKIKGENPPVKSFHLPPLHKPDEYDSLIKGLDHYARLDDKAYEEVKEGFRSYLERKGVDKSHYPWWLQNLRLLRWLMKEPETDTVWLFLLRNALMPTYCARRPYAFVVGNPPWIAYRYLKTKSYQDLVRRLFQEFDLIPKARGNLTTQLELATLFFAVSAQLYVREGGVVAFVMPRSILTGSKQHSPFQERYVSKSFLILDYERVEPLFNAPTCAILWKRQHSESPSSDSVCRKVISGNLPWRNMPWNDVQRYLTIEAQEWVYHPSSTSSSPYYSRFKNGATIVPRTFWFVRPISGGYYETDERILSYAKEPWKNIRLEGAIEEQFLYGTLLSNDLLPFGWRNLSLVVLPLLGATLLDVSEARKGGHIELAEWLEKAKDEWEKNKKSDDNLIEYLNWQNKLTSQNPRAPYRLLYNRSGTYLSAAVLEWKDDTEVMQVRVNGFFADTTTYVYVSSDPKELHFLCAILNAPSVDAAIKPHQTKGSFGARSGKGERDICRRPFEVLDIPLYDPHDEDHRKLAELSQQAHNDVRNFLENASPKDQDKPIGELRQDIRKKVIKEALSEIDKIVKRLLRL
ncbi:MAG: N-6 DNA methylase, partial [Nitrososphaerota archaeon]